MCSRRQLYDPNGRLIWDECGSQSLEVALAQLEGCGSRAVLVELLGGEEPRACGSGEILATTERLEFVSRVGCPQGFVNVLPKGVVFEQAVEAFNRSHVDSLGATRVQFPLVYDRRHGDIVELSEPFEKQGRIFAVEDPGHDYRLAYAADPGLFSWLRGRRLVPSKLPYVVYSPMPVFRRRLTGEIGLTAMRQYTLPDLHALCVDADASSIYRRFVKRASHSARLLFGEDWAQFLEVAPELSEGFPDLGAALAVAAGQYTVVRHLERRIRYFSLKGGINVHIGAGALMLFNFQWDATNSARFGFCTTDDRPVTVIHSTVAGAWAKVLPAMIGRGLSDQAPRTIPVEFAPVQVAVVPLTPGHWPAADEVGAGLRRLGLRVSVERASSRTLGARIRLLREAWNPFHVVVGDREFAGAPLLLRSPVDQRKWSLDGFVAEFGDRIAACQPIDPGIRLDLPFAD